MEGGDAPEERVVERAPGSRPSGSRGQARRSRAAEYGAMVREKRHHVGGVSQRQDGEEEGRRTLVWHAAHHGFKFELRLLSRRQDGCALPGKEGP
jgi:hypothetical protein